MRGRCLGAWWKAFLPIVTGHARIQGDVLLSSNFREGVLSANVDSMRLLPLVRNVGMDDMQALRGTITAEAIDLLGLDEAQQKALKSRAEEGFASVQADMARRMVPLGQ